MQTLSLQLTLLQKKKIRAHNKLRTKREQVLPFVLCVSKHPLELALQVYPWK